MSDSFEDFILQNAGTKVLRGGKDNSKLFENLPKGSWVALSHDEERVVAYAPELCDALQLAKERGEDDPLVDRIASRPVIGLYLLRGSNKIKSKRLLIPAQIFAFFLSLI